MQKWRDIDQSPSIISQSEFFNVLVQDANRDQESKLAFLQQCSNPINFLQERQTKVLLVPQRL